MRSIRLSTILIVAFTIIFCSRNAICADGLFRYSHAGALIGQVLGGSDQIAVRSNFQQASALANKGRYEAAMVLFEELYRQDPRMPYVDRWLGYCYMQLRLNEKALSIYKVAERRIPYVYQDGAFNIYNNLGILSQRLEKYEESFKYFKKALATGQSPAEAHTNLAFLYIEIRQYEKAIDSFKKAITYQPSIEAYQGLAQAYQQTGRHDDAATAVSNAIQLTPGDPAMWYTLGTIHRAAGHLDKAEQAFLECLKVSPNPYKKAYSTLSGVYNEMRRYTEAKKYAGKALNQDHFDWFAYRQLAIADAVLRNPNLDLEQYGRTYDESLKYLKEGWDLYRAKKFSEAKIQFKRAIAYVPSDLFSLSLLAGIAHIEGDLPAKAAYLRQCLELNPYDEESYRILAITYIRMGKGNEINAVRDPKTIKD